jgi:hypothetical protein
MKRFAILAVRNYLVLILLLFLTSPITPAMAQSGEFLTGIQFETKLAAPVTSTWKQPLKDVVGSIETTFKICLFVDRHIDPDQLIELQVEDLSLEQTLRRLALTANAEISIIQHVVYLGPKTTCTLLATIAEIHHDNLRTATKAGNIMAVRAEPIQWERLTNPQTLLIHDAQRIGFRYSNQEAIPFDLWDAGELARLPFAHRTTILLAGFNKTFQITDQQTLTIINFPGEASLKRSFNKQLSSVNISKIRSQFPTLKIQSNNSGLVVQGRWEEIHQLERLLAGGTSTTTKPATTGMQVYTLTVENQPIQAILQAIAQQEKLELIATDKAKAILAKQTSIEAKQLTLTQLLDKVTKSAGLTTHIENGKLSIDVREN